MRSIRSATHPRRSGLGTEVDDPGPAVQSGSRLVQPQMTIGPDPTQQQVYTSMG